MKTKIYGNPNTILTSLAHEINCVKKSIEADKEKISNKEEVIRLLERCFFYVQEKENKNLPTREELLEAYTNAVEK